MPRGRSELRAILISAGQMLALSAIVAGKDRLLAHASLFALSDRDEIVRSFTRGHHPEIDDVGSGRPPTPTDIETEIRQLAVPAIEHDARGAETAVAFPLDVARSIPVVAPRRPALGRSSA